MDTGVNGSLGTLEAIVYKHGTRPLDLPLYVLVEFDEFRGKCILYIQQVLSN